MKQESIKILTYQELLLQVNNLQESPRLWNHLQEFHFQEMKEPVPETFLMSSQNKTKILITSVKLNSDSYVMTKLIQNIKNQKIKTKLILTAMVNQTWKNI